MIEIKNIIKKYDSFLAVDNISLKINKGEIFALLGPNGAGKTTLINCITQLSNITSGSIKVNGCDNKTNYLEARKQIGLSPQEFLIDPYFTIIELLTYQGGYFGLAKKEAKKRAIKLLKEFNLFEKKDSKLKELSGGMKRKISIIKALMHKPEVLILDEPTAALDVDSRIELWSFIKKLNENKITIILTTHYIEEAERLSDRVAIINKGKLVKLDKTKNILDNLSQNLIIIHTKKDSNPKDFKYEKEKNKLIIKTSKKDQSKKLREVLKKLEQQKIDVENFQIKQDNLENIFRRIVNE